MDKLSWLSTIHLLCRPLRALPCFLRKPLLYCVSFSVFNTSSVFKLWFMREIAISIGTCGRSEGSSPVVKYYMVLMCGTHMHARTSYMSYA